MDGEFDTPALTFGLAALLSGVSFHTHGAVFAEVTVQASCGGNYDSDSCVTWRAQVQHGSKLWFLSPPSERPLFHGDVTQMQVT